MRSFDAATLEVGLRVSCQNILEVGVRVKPVSPKSQGSDYEARLFSILVNGKK